MVHIFFNMDTNFSTIGQLIGGGVNYELWKVLLICLDRAPPAKLNQKGIWLYGCFYRNINIPCI
jgi:hypothetical protein